MPSPDFGAVAREIVNVLSGCCCEQDHELVCGACAVVRNALRTARDQALEEAARLATDVAQEQRGQRLAPDYVGNWADHGEAMAESLAAAIRALKEQL
jgi:hypothetical protein